MTPSPAESTCKDYDESPYNILCGHYPEDKCNLLQPCTWLHQHIYGENHPLNVEKD